MPRKCLDSIFSGMVCVSREVLGGSAPDSHAPPCTATLPCATFSLTHCLFPPPAPSVFIRPSSRWPRSPPPCCCQQQPQTLPPSSPRQCQCTRQQQQPQITPPALLRKLTLGPPQHQGVVCREATSGQAVWHLGRLQQGDQSSHRLCPRPLCLPWTQPRCRHDLWQKLC